MAGPIASTIASRVTNRYASARAASVARTGADYLGGASDFGAGFFSRATGLNASTGAPSVAGTAGELTGLSVNGAISSGSHYQTNQQASFARSGGMASVPTTSQMAMDYVQRVHSPEGMARGAQIMSQAMGRRGTGSG